MKQFLITTSTDKFLPDLKEYIAQFQDQYGETATFELFEVNPPIEQKFTAIAMKKIL